MIAQLKYPAGLMSAILWVGFVCAISFMEAWLKFRAPGVTQPIGLGIGRLVFGALNKVEWLFATVILINILWKGGLFSTFHLLVCIPVVILLLQTFWLLPVLDQRAEMHIQGREVAPSHLHFYYVGMELVKVSSLIILGFRFLNTMEFQQKINL